MAVNNPPQQKRLGTGFTNLQRLMQANVGNRLSSTVGQGIQRVGQQARSQLGEAEQRFGQQAEAGRLGTEAERERVENVLGAPEQATEQDIQEFGRFRAGQFTGPRGLQDVETLRGQAKEAEQLGKSIGSTGGRQGLLQRFAAGPGQYGSGAQRLDTLLLGAGAGGQQLREARRSVSGLGAQTDTRAQAAQEVARQYESQARGFGEEVAQRTGQMAGEALGTAQQRAQAAMEADRQLRERAESERQSAAQNRLTQQALEALGLEAGQRTYGVNLGEFLGYQGRGAGDVINPEEVMNQQEFQRFANLRRLMGGTAEGFDPSKVGGYQAGQQTFNREGLQQAIGQAQATLDPARAGLQSAQQISDWQRGALDGGRRQEALNDLKNTGQTLNSIMDQQTREQVYQQAGLNPYSMAPLTPEEQARIEQIALSNPQVNAALGQRLIVKYHPGAAHGGYTRADWAAANLATAQQRLQQEEARLGGNVELIPSEDMENFPQVT